MLDWVGDGVGSQWWDEGDLLEVDVVVDLRLVLDYASVPSFHQVVLEWVLVCDFSRFGVEVERFVVAGCHHEGDV